MEIPMPNQSKKYFLSTLEKGLKVLSLFNHERTQISQIEIAKLIDTDKTSTYRLVNTLVILGFLKKDPQSKLLKLGTQSFTLAQNFIQGFDLLQIIRPVIDAEKRVQKYLPLQYMTTLSKNIRA